MIATVGRWLILTVAVWVAAYIIPGITYDVWHSLLIAALVLGILNAFVKPVLMLISMPFIMITLGLFLILINALLLKLTAWLVPGLHIASFWSALAGGVVISLVSFFLGRPRPYLHARRVLPELRPSPPPGGPIIDI
ncbi:MAG: phage holin family protein [Lentisphaerae bacterium]|nr:phage holin family protein [Lentisphaerota bacterium]